MRDRLIELLEKADETVMGFSIDGDVSILADYLIANGVIVSPCKVRDTVYYLTTIDTEKELNVTEIFCGTVIGVSFDKISVWVSVKYTNGLFYCHNAKDFGKTVFLTKEEAEKELKRRADDGKRNSN